MQLFSWQESILNTQGQLFLRKCSKGHICSFIHKKNFVKLGTITQKMFSKTDELRKAALCISERYEKGADKPARSCSLLFAVLIV